ncbi:MULTISPECIES: hypothetical protein [unclassified Pseudomonas]|uniref:hypothetical protein n=1 Tax=unclassified Pseudomonas TaxID=196821 RepID=UPI00131A81DF|nr:MULTISPECIES: hypothetical protein [unclassified Pseudomonas]
MAAMALNSIRVLANARKMAPPFPFGIAAKHALTPTLSLRERGLIVRAFIFRNQSLTLGGMDLQVGAERSEAQKHKPHSTIADSAPG